MLNNPLTGLSGLISDWWGARVSSLAPPVRILPLCFHSCCLFFSFLPPASHSPLQWLTKPPNHRRRCRLQSRCTTVVGPLLLSLSHDSGHWGKDFGVWGFRVCAVTSIRHHRRVTGSLRPSPSPLPLGLTRLLSKVRVARLRVSVG